MSEELSIGLLASNNLSDVQNRNTAAINLGIRRDALATIKGIGQLGLTNLHLLSTLGSSGSIQDRLDGLNASINQKLNSAGGTFAGNIKVDGKVKADIRVAPSVTALAASTDANWVTGGIDGIQYTGNVALTQNLQVSELTLSAATIISISGYSFNAGFRAPGDNSLGFTIPCAVRV